jgi:sterol-4alpha-carboxylate 3-dehydrogenase (decarboxylating)
MNEPAPLKSVLVVGGCGFLGHHIVHAVFNTYEQGLKMSVLDLYTTKNRHPDATYYTGDITSPSQVQRILSIVKPIVIVHTASPTAMSTKPSARTMFYKVNVEGTRNLLECAHAIGNVKAFIYTSSSSVVHNQRDSLVQATENMPVLTTPDQQPEYYSQTKAIAENMVTSANRNQGSEMLTASIRPAMMFGPGK